MYVTIDGILGFLGAIIGVIGAYGVAKWQNNQPLRNSISNYKFFLANKLTGIKNLSYLTDEYGRMKDESQPHSDIKKISDESNKIIEEHHHLFCKKKNSIINNINKELNDLYGDVYQIRYINQSNTEPYAIYYLKDYPFVADKTAKIIKLLDKL